MLSHLTQRTACRVVVIGAVAGLGCGATREPAPDEPRTFVGSAACESCHQDLYARWKETLMAKVLQDTTERPQAILADFSTPNPLVTFTKDDVLFTYGSKWKQRYYTRIGDDYFVFPAQWDVRNKTWRPYYVRPGTDYACHDTHGTEHEADLVLPDNDVCTQCHTAVLQPGPRGSLEFHTQHAADNEGSRCVACHMPPIEQTIADVNVHSHTFRFISPVMTERYGVPNPCTTCHQDKSVEWAIEDLETWPGVSPWRVGG